MSSRRITRSITRRNESAANNNNHSTTSTTNDERSNRFLSTIREPGRRRRRHRRNMHESSDANNNNNNTNSYTNSTTIESAMRQMLFDIPLSGNDQSMNRLLNLISSTQLQQTQPRSIVPQLPINGNDNQGQRNFVRGQENRHISELRPTHHDIGSINHNNNNNGSHRYGQRNRQRQYSFQNHSDTDVQFVNGPAAMHFFNENNNLHIASSSPQSSRPTTTTTLPNVDTFSFVNNNRNETNTSSSEFPPRNTRDVLVIGESSDDTPLPQPSWGRLQRVVFNGDSYITNSTDNFTPRPSSNNPSPVVFRDSSDNDNHSNNHLPNNNLSNNNLSNNNLSNNNLSNNNLSSNNLSNNNRADNTPIERPRDPNPFIAISTIGTQLDGFFYQSRPFHQSLNNPNTIGPLSRFNQRNNARNAGIRSTFQSLRGGQRHPRHQFDHPNSVIFNPFHSVTRIESIYDDNDVEHLVHVTPFPTFGFRDSVGELHSMKEVVKSLHKSTYENTKNTFHEVKCGICLEGYSPDSVVLEMYPCEHIFHMSCVKQWLYSTLSCPVCRKEVTEPPIVI